MSTGHDAAPRMSVAQASAQGTSAAQSSAPHSSAAPESATPESATPESATPESATPESATPESATGPDLAPAASAVAAVVRGVRDDQLGAPTPCPDMTVAALLDHLHGLAWAFRAAAEKSPEATGTAPQADTGSLVPAWRDEIPARLDALARAWAAPEAWTGMTAVGGLDLPGEIAGVIALDEIVLHGWDLAVATGQEFRPDDGAVEAVYGFTAAMSAPGEEAGRQGLFGPVVPVPDDAPLFDRALGFAGRDPHWKP